MPIAKIQLPDGRIARFEVAEGTTPEQVTAFASQNLGGLEKPEVAQDPSLLSKIARPILQTAKNITTGAVGTIGDLSQQAVYAPEILLREGAGALGFDVKPFDTSRINTVSPMIRKGFDTATGGLTKARGETEEVVEMASEMLSGGIGTGAVKTAASFVSDISTLIGKRALQFGTGVTKKSQELVRDFTDSGVNPTLANIAEGKKTATFQNLVGNFPGGKGIIEKATQDQIDSIAKQLSGITGKGGTTQQTGKVIQEGAISAKQASEARVSKLYDDLDKFIPKDDIQPPKNSVRLYRGLEQKFDKNYNLSSTDAPSGYSTWTDNPELAKQYAGKNGRVYKIDLPKNELKKELIDIDGERALFLDNQKAAGLNGVSGKEYLLYNDHELYNPNLIKELGGNSKIPTNNLKAAFQDEVVTDALINQKQTSSVLTAYERRLQAVGDNSGQIPYKNLKSLRSNVGKKLQSGLLEGDEKGALKKLYGALSEDMKAAVTAQGGEKALQSFNKANNAFIRQTNILNKTLDPLIKADTPEKVYNMALSGTKQGGTNIKRIMRGLNSTQQEFVRGTVTNRMGLAQPGQQDSFGEVFSPNKFLTEWNKLSPEARVNIFTAKQTDSINTLNKAISTIKEAGKARQTSNTLPYLGYVGLGSLLATNVFAAAGVAGGANITARMMTNPRFVKWLAQAPKVRRAEIPKHLKALSTIAGVGNTELNEDILSYIESITLENE